MKSRIIPVIMSGGSGTRLWPLSTDDRPKQFQSVGEGPTLIQATARRFVEADGVEFLSPIVICNERHLGLVQEQLNSASLTPSSIILEPAPRNTAAVAVAAALAADEIDPDALVLLAPSDHMMRRPKALIEAVVRAQEVARSHIVTFGIHARTPATGYGYIKRSGALAPEVFGIERFLEKPPLEQAQAYVADGGYDWNAGLFLFAPEVLAQEADRHAPAVWSAVQAAFSSASRDGPVVRLDSEAFAGAPSISVDHAIMEKTARGAVAPCDPEWSDIGGWSEYWTHLEHDDLGNALINAVAVDGENNLVWGVDGRPVAVVGLSNVVAISTDAGVLIVPRDRDQDVRNIHDALKALKSKA